MAIQIFDKPAFTIIRGSQVVDEVEDPLFLALLFAALYDYVTLTVGSLPEEVDLVWCRYMGLAYLMIPVAVSGVKKYDVLVDLNSALLEHRKYVPITFLKGNLLTHPQEIRDAMFTLQRAGLVSFLPAIQGVILLRVCAIHGRKRHIKWILSSLFLIEISLAFYGVFGQGSSVTSKVLLINTPILAFECLLLTLLLHGLTFLRTTLRHITRLQGWKSLVTVVLRDGVFYFLIMLVLVVVQTVSLWYFGDFEQVLVVLGIFLEGVLGPRLAASLTEALSERHTVYLVPY
ncbi:hypothetical protein CONPUDRAFT_143234 [Coniophora puteana RWD-64-598 SS2]|uniref:Uncharacterized protein n=1 Tax=Coniophora puteana (strain RWD-64-598) TaxID=741705 RepID=A0A5M3MVY0_CONPW|nr:uncharacterized protein CONPUDRAFT_143234 [Coniophora puteana RWD-64-598 SS2]EIW83276.1 hypothetical protein CONPUDRAFT_143234 [Coniophora puteana RWD-64-598 SS2]